MKGWGGGGDSPLHKCAAQISAGSKTVLNEEGSAGGGSLLGIVGGCGLCRASAGSKGVADDDGSRGGGFLLGRVGRCGLCKAPSQTSSSSLVSYRSLNIFSFVIM
jgi:hypothetical protein